MALGELYYPKGKAKETASEVLEVEKPMSCNVALGCTNQCGYCYSSTGTGFFAKHGLEPGELRKPKRRPAILVGKQLEKGLKPEGVFLSFMTDPFIKENREASDELIHLLTNEYKIPVATLSKVDVPGHENLIRTGMTIASPDERFRKKFEPNATPIKFRIDALKKIATAHGYTWVSIEPYPTPEIWVQELKYLLEKLKFVDFMVLGKMNYDKRASKKSDKEFYRKIATEFQEFCKENRIRSSVKANTLKFMREDPKK